MRAPAVWQGLATNVSLLRVRRAGPGGTVYRVLNPAPAEDSDSITVTRATAAKYKLKSIADPRRPRPCRGSGLLFEPEADFQSDLPMCHLAALDRTTDLRDFEPVKVP